MSCKNECGRQSNFFDTCSNCKANFGCCNGTRPPITRERRKIIEAYLEMEKIPVENPFVEEGYVFPRLDIDGYCVFHDKKTRKCIIHAVKPETCVAGPITFDVNTKTGRIDWFIKMERICPLAGIVYADKQSLQKHFESAKREITRLVSELDTKALKAILKKEEPETIKIDGNNIEK